MSFPPHVLRDWVQQQEVARYTAELTGFRPEREVEELTASLRTRISVLSDMEVVLYCALLLGPQAMSDCLLGALQQRARSTHRFGHLLPPGPAHALPPCRPCVGPGQGLVPQPSSSLSPMPPGVAASAHTLNGAPSLAPTRAPLTPAGPLPPASVACGGAAGHRPHPFVRPGRATPATPVRDFGSARADGPAGPPPPAPASHVVVADRRLRTFAPVGSPPATPAPAGPPPPAPASCLSSAGRRPCPGPSTGHTGAGSAHDSGLAAFRACGRR